MAFAGKDSELMEVAQRFFGGDGGVRAAVPAAAKRGERLGPGDWIWFLGEVWELGVGRFGWAEREENGWELSFFFKTRSLPR